MLIVVSPAKTLDFESAPVTNLFTQTDFPKESQQIIEEIRSLTAEDIAVLMKLSEKLAELNHQRFADWSLPFTPENAKAAVLAFKGDVYTGMDAESFSDEDFDYAQEHLRLLSGLYGLLRPLDLIQAYRLEMGTKFANSRGKNLYEFWGTLITDKLNEQLAKTESQFLINLASNEYFKAVKKKELKGQIITPVFKDCKNGKYKIISFYAKKARGMMAAYIIKNRLNSIEDLKKFDTQGYNFSESESTDHELVFTREEQ